MEHAGAAERDKAPPLNLPKATAVARRFSGHPAFQSAAARGWRLAPWLISEPDTAHESPLAGVPGHEAATIRDAIRWALVQG